MFHSFSNLRSNPFYVDSISDPKQVLDAAKKELKFTNGTADYSVFGKKYDKQSDQVRDDGVAQTSLGRKIWAIPNMAIGIIKTISHLAFSLLLYILKAPSDVSTKYKFCATRDLEEVYGNFVAIFNDKLGLYHIQQAQFQKKCYHAYSPRVIYSYLHNNGPLNQEFASKYSFNGSSSVGKFTSDRMINDAVKEITLSAYKSLSVEERKTVIKMVSGFSADFSKILESLPSKGLDLDQLLETANDDILEMFTLEDLQFFDLSPLKFVLKKDDEIANLTFEELGIANIHKLNNGEISKIQYLSKRLNTIDLAKDELGEIVQDINTLGGAADLSAEEILLKLHDLHPLTFSFFTNEQIAMLDFNFLTHDQASAMFAALDNEDVAERLSIFKEEDLISAVNKNALCKKALQNLPASCLSKIQLSKLPNKTIEGMFSWYAKDKKAEAERFALLNTNEVVLALKYNLLSWNHLQLLSKDQLKTFQAVKRNYKQHV
ncbi:MAG: hypothetical protein H0W50_07850 [Parachlamydiaceae bacterium]|nr:hypothetical protein [Parachlamydiaceae bacterium]